MIRFLLGLNLFIAALALTTGTLAWWSGLYQQDADYKRVVAADADRARCERQLEAAFHRLKTRERMR